MTPLETKMANMDWLYTGRAMFTAVNEGFGFVVYQQGKQMWVAGIPKYETDRRRAIHAESGSDPRGVVACGLWLQDTMFNVPASIDLVSAVVLSAYPELTA